MPTSRRSGGTQTRPGHRPPVELDLPSSGRSAGDQAQEGGLSAAARAEERDELSARDLEVCAVDGPNGAEAPRDARHADHHVHGGRTFTQARTGAERGLRRPPPPPLPPLICIDPGHARRPNFETEPLGPGSKKRKIKDGGGAPGEAPVVLAISKTRALKDRGFRVAMTRTTRRTSRSRGRQHRQARVLQPAARSARTPRARGRLDGFARGCRPCIRGTDAAGRIRHLPAERCAPPGSCSGRSCGRPARSAAASSAGATRPGSTGRTSRSSSSRPGS